MGVEQTNTDQWHTQVRCRLHVIARKHTKSARVDWQAWVNAKLHGEVRDEWISDSIGCICGVLVPQLVAEVFAEVLLLGVDST